MTKVYIALFISMMAVGCATKIGPPPEGIDPVPAPVVETKPEPEAITKYSDINNVSPTSDRNFRRMTRETMEQESDLQASAGSLWQMEGQNSFLFSKNQNHVEGDPTAIKVEGTALKLIEAKVAVIQDLMKELEILRVKAEQDQKNQEQEKIHLAEAEKIKKENEAMMAKDPMYDPYAGQYPVDPSAVARAPAADSKPDPAKDLAADKGDKAAETIDLKDVENIPSRIVEKTKDGMYRIRGQQYLTIKKRPYKVIATGLVRPEDFSDTMISSGKLLDPQFDVIHIKRTE